MVLADHIRVKLMVYDGGLRVVKYEHNFGIVQLIAHISIASEVENVPQSC
jgi:hypothetical protein